MVSGTIYVTKRLCKIPRTCARGNLKLVGPSVVVVVVVHKKIRQIWCRGIQVKLNSDHKCKL